MSRWPSSDPQQDASGIGDLESGIDLEPRFQRGQKPVKGDHRIERVIWAGEKLELGIMGRDPLDDGGLGGRLREKGRNAHHRHTLSNQ